MPKASNSSRNVKSSIFGVWGGLMTNFKYFKGFLKSCVKKNASKKCFFSITGGGGLPIMENSIKRMFFFIETFPNLVVVYVGTEIKTLTNEVHARFIDLSFPSFHT